METKFGFPVVNAENYLDVFANMGVRPWPRLKEPVLLEEYLKGDLTENQRSEAVRFAPKSEVVIL